MLTPTSRARLLVATQWNRNRRDDEDCNTGGAVASFGTSELTVGWRNSRSLDSSHRAHRRRAFPVPPVYINLAEQLASPAARRQSAADRMEASLQARVCDAGLAGSHWRPCGSVGLVADGQLGLTAQGPSFSSRTGPSTRHRQQISSEMSTRVWGTHRRFA